MAEAAPNVLERNNFVDQRPFSLNPKQYTQESWSTAYTRPSATAKLLKCTQVWIRLPLWYSTRPVFASSARRLAGLVFFSLSVLGSPFSPVEGANIPPC